MRTKRAGITLLEALSGVMLASVLVLMVMTFTTTSGKIALNFDAKSRSLRKAREAVEMLTRDLQTADRVLVSYDGFESDVDSTIVLRIPKNDGAGTVIAGHDVVAYRNESRGLVRYREIGGSLTEDRVFSPRPESLTFTYLGVQSFEGDGATQEFPLVANVWGLEPSTVLMNGVDAISTGEAQVFSNKVQFSYPPAAGAQIDVTYPLAPSEDVGDDANGAGMVVVKVAHQRPNVAGAGYDQTSTQYKGQTNPQGGIETRVLLRNREIE